MALRRTNQTDTAAAITEAVQAERGQAAPAAPDNSEVASISPAVAERVRSAVAGIPSDDDSGAEAIVTALLDADSIDALNSPWEGQSLRELAGARIRIDTVRRRPSQFNEGAGVFLVVEGVNTGTGERITATTSALSVVIQLARAFQLGLFPLIADVIVADKPTERGFYPYHLRITGANTRGAQASDGPAPF